MGIKNYLNSLELLNNYAATLATNSLADIQDGEYQFEDVLDDAGQGRKEILIKAAGRFEKGNITVDVAGTVKQGEGKQN